jgi:hypothetical protein
MSEPANQIAAAGEGGQSGDSVAAPSSPSPASGWRMLAIGLAGALVLLVALVGTAPFWASALPWAPLAPKNEPPPPDPRIDQLAATQQQAGQQRQQDEAAANAAVQRLDKRIGALEAKPAPAASDIAELRQQVAKLSATATELTTRVEALDKTLRAQAPATADLAARIEAVDKAAHSQATSGTGDTAAVLVLLQIQDAVAVGRPFAAEYEALAALARASADLMTAAQPLAEPAKSGVAGRAVLANRLRELAPAITTAKAAEAAGAAGGADWTDRLLGRLAGLVQVRRVDGTGEGQSAAGGSQAVVNEAERALAGGDLEGAVAIVEKLSGPPAEAAAPWLRMAKQRLAVEAALHHIEALLAARLGAAANASTPASGPPAK